MSDFHDLLEEVLRIGRELKQLRADYDNTFIQGPVTDSDHEKGVRVGRDKDGKSKSDWTRPAELTGRSRALPRKGEQVLILQPHGDARQGVAIGLGHSKDRKNPAKDAKNTVISDIDGCRIESDGDGVFTVTCKKVLFKTGGVTWELSESGEITKGGTVKHDDKNIGKDHVHLNVQTGAAKSGPPDA